MCIGNGGVNKISVEFCQFIENLRALVCQKQFALMIGRRMNTESFSAIGFSSNYRSVYGCGGGL